MNSIGRILLVGIWLLCGGSYGRDWSVNEVVLPLAKPSQVYVYLKKQGESWKVIGGHSDELGHATSIDVDAATDVERLIVGKEGWVALSIPTLKKQSCRGNASSMDCVVVPMPAQGASTAECVVGVGHGRDTTVAARKYTFCNSDFVSCQKDAKGVLKMGLTGLIGGMSAICNATFDRAKLQATLQDADLARAIEEAYLDVARRVEEDRSLAMARADEDKRKVELARMDEYRQKSEEKRQKFELQLKGQKFIADSAIGEMLCADAELNYRSVVISGFLEGVKGNKIQLRVNRVGTRTGFESWQGDVVISGVTYRSGNLVWTDAKLWRACES